ncbi:MAG: dTDP-4-dehydrorhamnose 3,5-epimerase [Novosphingobium sp.]
MHFSHLAIAGLVEITPRRIADGRGWFAEVFRADLLAEHIGAQIFVQENAAFSAATGTVRGLHFQTPPHAQGKLVSCLAGAILDVAVDLRHGSPGFGQWLTVTLDAAKGNQLWVPPGFAHGYCTLAPDTTVAYKVTAPYSPAHDKGLAWDDPALAIAWPALADPHTLSARDRDQPRLADLPAYFGKEGGPPCA